MTRCIVNNENNKYFPIIACNIKRFRREKKITQRELGKILKVTYQQIQKYEHGLNRISADNLYTIALFFKIPIDRFFRE